MEARRWKHDGLNFFLSLLKDPFWANPALEAILSWLVASLFPCDSLLTSPVLTRLQDETARVEDCLLEPAALESLLRVFCKTKTTTFENLLEPFQKVSGLWTSEELPNKQLSADPPNVQRGCFSTRRPILLL